MKYTISFLLLALVSCSPSTETNQVPGPESYEITLTPAQLSNAGIVSGLAEVRAISSLLKVSGKIDVPPQNMVSVSVPLGGYLKWTKLLPGMQVRKGEVLAIMEDAQYIQLQQDYLTAKSQLTFIESEYNRQKSLNASKASSDKVFEQARSSFQSQQILVASLAEKLKLIGLNPDRIGPSEISRSIRIYSPIDGFVSAVKMNIGKFVNPSDVLFELVNPSDIHLNLTVFEKDVNKLVIGQQLIAYSNSDPSIKYPCSILLISKSLSDTRSSDVHCHFEKYDKRLLPGMFMNAEIEVKSDSSLSLPEEAVVRFENKFYVFEDPGTGKFTMKEVTPGETENGFIAIRGLTGGATKYVLKGAYNLLMASKNTEAD